MAISALLLFVHVATVASLRPATTFSRRGALAAGAAIAAVPRRASALNINTYVAGLDKDAAKEVVKLIKAEKLKVQPQIQDDQVRVTGKKRDDLQAVISLLKAADFRRPLQYINMRD